jgi:uncharacterized protein with PIN domain
MKFLVDSMLGKLAKWLRVMGQDAHYLSFHRKEDMASLIKGGRTLLSRHKKTVDRYPGALMIHSDHVKEQLHEIQNKFQWEPDRSQWFTRCLICNVLLKRAQIEHLRANIPDYIFYENPTHLRICPSCGRYFWPGSHRERMLNQLEDWGF